MNFLNITYSDVVLKTGLGLGLDRIKGFEKLRS